MKKFRLINIVLCALLICILIPVSGSFSVSADSYYPMACSTGQFEVSSINDDGSFTKISCHANFNDAIKAMKKNDDYVVRYGKSYSPTRIVAMNSGLAYSYPGRRNSSTMYLFQNPLERNSSAYKSTYISNHYEMTYIETLGPDIYDIAPAGKGYIRIVMNGFEGYADLEYIDLVPEKYIRNQIPIWLGGNNTYEDEEPFLVKVKQNYYEIVKNGKYYDLVFHYFRAYPKSGKNGNEALEYTINADNAENYLNAGMQTGKKYYSNDGIRFYADPSLSSFVAECYNYYQFLPIRSKTNISAATLNQFMKETKGSSSVMYNQADAFINSQNKYGCNALMIYAMACLESAYGTSGYAVNRNNLFGWAAYDDSPNNATYFSSVSACVKEQMGRNLAWFMDYTNRRYFGTCVGNKGSGFNVSYASDPYWGVKIASIAYQIDKYANNKNGNLSDYNAYTIGFVKNNYNDVLYDSNIKWDPNIYKSNDGNQVLYTGRFGKHYQKDLTVLVINQTDGRYKIQSTNPVKNGSINTEDGILTYDWDKSVGYIDTEDVILLNNKSVQQILTNPVEAESFTIVDSIKMDDQILTISGIGGLSSYDFKEKDSVSHKINIYDLSNQELVDSFICENIDTAWYNLNDGHNYTWAGFRGSYDISNLDEGSYIFRIETRIENTAYAQSLLKCNQSEFSLLTNQNENKVYKIALNEIYGYRIELDIDSAELDYTAVNKPSMRSSLATIDNVTYQNDDGKEYALFDGVGMIYYLNYDSEDNMHQLYLVNRNETIPVPTETKPCSFDYSSFYDSSYNMDHICYSAKADLSGLEGEYRIMLKIRNGSYSDLLEIDNRFNTQYESHEYNNRNISFLTDSIRYRLLMKVNTSN
ncbi:MAG: glucosaminidase domain-containing protein [Erysipelotrichaceae bacterium]|nr:glucosaminidase domain-containing protein [Erysipelotrichaceae bacterium]